MTINFQMLQDLRAALDELHGYKDRLTPREVTPQLLRELYQGLGLARSLVAAAGRLPVTHCRTHPDGPVDPEAGGCLLCNTRRRAATTPPRPQLPPVQDVLAAITAHGRQEAARRYGARAVVRALAAAGRGTTSTLPPAHRRGA